MQWSPLVFVLGCGVCAMLEKESSNFYTPGLVQRCSLVLVLGCSICIALKKELSDFHNFRGKCLHVMQWGPLVFVAGCGICAVLEKELSNLYSPCLMQWSSLALV